MQMNALPYRAGTILNNVSINVVLDQGGLGDMICRMSAVKYMLRHNPHVDITMWCPDYFMELAPLFFDLHDKIEIRHINDYSSACDWDKPHFNFKHPQHTSMATNLTRYAFNMLINKEVPEEELEYPKLITSSLNPLDSDYVVITSNYTAPARRFMPEQLQYLIDNFTELGFKVILLGKKSFTVKASRGSQADREINSETIKVNSHDLVLDKRDQTTLIEALRIMAGAQAVLGVDNGLIHLAACTNVPIICGFTSVAPEHRRIIRNGQANWRVYPILPSAALPCRFCESKMGLIYGHRFKYCYYDDYKCCEQMRADKFFSAYKQMIQDVYSEPKA